jgi:hypothetical protein
VLSILADVRDEDMPTAAARPVHERHRPRHHWTRTWPVRRHSAITRAPARSRKPPERVTTGTLLRPLARRGALV